MILCSNLTTKEKTYLCAMVNASKRYDREFNLDTFTALKKGVLESVVSDLKIDRRKIKVLQNIIAKVRYAGEIKECKEKTKEIIKIESV